MTRRELAGVGAAACVACCAAPLLGLLGGIGAAGLVGCLWVGGIAMVIAALVAAAVVARRRRSPTELATMPGRRRPGVVASSAGSAESVAVELRSRVADGGGPAA